MHTLTVKLSLLFNDVVLVNQYAFIFMYNYSSIHSVNYKM